MPTPGQSALRRAYAVLPLGWAGLVLLLTLTPARDMPTTPVWELLSFDTAAHAGVFAVLAGLSWFSLSRQRRWPRVARYAGAVVLAGSILFGGLIELLQHTMHLGRQGDWTDLLSDGIGAALAVGAATWWARRRVRRAPPRTLLFWAATLLAGLSGQSVQAQDLPRARRTIRTLAARAMHGRGYVQQGENKAAAYLRRRLKELKLEPLAPDYTQPFTLDINTFPGQMALQLEDGLMPGKGRQVHLQPGRDFIATATSAAGRLAGARLCYLDSATVSSPAAVAEFMRISQPPCMAVLLDRYVQQGKNLPQPVRTRLDSVAAVLRIVPKLTASLAATQCRQLQLEALPHPLLHQPQAATDSAAHTVTATVDAQLRRDYQTQNLAAVLRGTVQPDSFLVVTAHYDHLGTMGRHAYFPGANDNASGVALLLELASHYARPENRPAYSVVFLLFGAEEAGLVGSRYFVAHPLVPLNRIKFLVNLDLLGTGEQGATVVNGRVLPAPYQRLVQLNEAHHYLPALGARGRAANSDHHPFSEAGVPAFFLYTRGGSPAYHDVNDRPEALSLAGFAGAYGLVRDFLNELGAAQAPKK